MSAVTLRGPLSRRERGGRTHGHEQVPLATDRPRLRERLGVHGRTRVLSTDVCLHEMPLMKEDPGNLDILKLGPGFNLKKKMNWPLGQRAQRSNFISCY